MKMTVNFCLFSILCHFLLKSSPPLRKYRIPSGVRSKFGVCDFSPQDFSSQTFSLHLDPNHNPSPNSNTNPDPTPNPLPPVAVTYLKIKGRVMNYLEINCPVPQICGCNSGYTM